MPRCFLRLVLLWWMAMLLVCMVIEMRASATSASGNLASSFYIAERGPNHRIWKSVVTETSLSGEVISRTNSFTELATGLHYSQNGQWVDASDIINLASDGSGASATNSQHQVGFSANLNVAGAINLVMPQGGQLQSSVVGLRYENPTTGQNVAIASVKDSTGQLLPSLNQVVYTNALTDSNSTFYADVLYSHRRNGFEQDIILREQPPTPEQFGLNPTNTLLQVWTEFFNAPEPIITTNWRTIWMGTGNQQTLSDERLDFGSMQMSKGHAFAGGANTNAAETAAGGMKLVPVSKHWIHYQARTFLVEEVPYLALAPELNALPPSTSSNSNAAPASSDQPQSFFRVLPHKERDAQAKTSRMTLTKADFGNRPGLLLDYNLINATETNFTFQSDTTYYLSGENDLYLTTTIEGGAVLKCGPSSSSSAVVEGSINWQTSSYRPAIFTCTNDNSVGVPLTTNGNPTLTITTDANWLQGGSIHDARFSYAWNAFSGDGTNVDISDCQFVDCDHPITVNSGTTNLGLHNVLITMNNAINNSTNFCGCPPGALVIYSQALRCYGEHVTADLGSQNFITYFSTLSTPSNTTVKLTNCIVLTPHLNPMYSSGSSVGYTVFTNSTYYAGSNPGTLFQSVGAGNYYLATNSPCRGAGTNNILSTTLADIQQKTTYPPLIYATNIISYDLVLSPYVEWDTNSSPDEGYHYAPIDYAFGGVLASNATIAVTSGTTLGAFATNGSPAGLTIGSGAQFLCQGTPLALNRIANFNTVQEEWYTNWTTPAQALLLPNPSTNTPSSLITCRFTDFSILAQDTAHVFNTNGATLPVDFQDCQFHGGLLYSTNATINLTNCLLERVNATLWAYDGNAPQIRNNLFWRGSLDVKFTPTNSLIQDNLFDETTLNDHGIVNYVGAYNGYVSNFNHLTLTNGADVYLSNSPAYESSYLGGYYLPPGSPLIDKGSTTADVLGLYDYTTQTNQVPETNSPVDIGYHYVALNTNGVPITTSGDGTPDYLAGSGGTGTYNSFFDQGNWTNHSNCGDGVSDYLKFVQGRNVSICTLLSDTNGILDLQVYTPLK